MAERNDKTNSKQQLRRQLRRRLSEITPEQRIVKSKKACRHLISTEQFQNASTVMLFLSLAHEADTSEAILSAWQMGKTVAVPKISWQQRHMIAVEINSLETGFSTEVSGLRNPVTGMPIPFEEIELVVTPGLCFDRSGHRLGRGGAYYDSFFCNDGLEAVRCGFGFSEQVVERVPVTSTDVPMDFLITEEGVIYCKDYIQDSG